jgi:catechol 2,3-dioxygenase-like lactoylglutathione lyase family enzyme
VNSTHLTVACDDVAAGARFFSDVLALPVSQRHPDRIEVRLGATTATLTSATSTAGPDGLEVRPEPGHRPGVILQVEVPDVAAAVDEVYRRGGEVLLEAMVTEWGTISAFIAGPDGVVVELYRPRDL